MVTYETVESQRADRATKTPVPGRGVLTARTGAAAVNDTERRLCGVGASHTVGAAEGVAMAGWRAATLLAAGEASTEMPPSGAGVVHHRIGGEPEGDSVRRPAFELVAGSAQEAVDHCLVAHLLGAAASGCGLCTVDRSIAEELHLLRLPEEETIACVLGPTGATGAVAAPGGGRPDLLTAAPGLFAFVAESTGRACGAVVADHVEPDSCVLVAVGRTRVRAEAVARLLRGEGVPCGVVGVALVYPEPVEELGEALSEAAAIAVLEPDGGTRGGIDLTALVRRSLSPQGGDAADTAAVGEAAAPGGTRAPAAPRVSAVHTIASDRGDDAKLAALVRDALGLPAPTPPTATAEEAAAKAFAIGVVPAGDWGETFLLEVAALVGRGAAPALARGDIAGTSSLIFHPEEGDGAARDSLDLLLATHHSLLTPATLASSLRDGGAVLLVHPGRLSPASLTPELRVWLDAHDIRLHSLDFGADRVPAAPATASCESMVRGALLACCPSLIRRLGGDGELLALLDEEGGESALTDTERRQLREGAAAVRTVDLGAAEEKAYPTADAPARALPHMPPDSVGEAVGELAGEEWRASLRHFHLTGKGSYSSADPLLALPLRPVAVSPLATAESVCSQYPLVLLDRTDATASAPDLVPFVELAGRALAGIEQEGEGASPILGQHLARLAAAVAEELPGDDGPSALEPVFAAARARLTRDLDLSSAGAEALARELNSLEGRLPAGARVVGLRASTFSSLLSRAVKGNREERIRSYRDEARMLSSRLSELLQVDASHGAEGSTPQVLSASLGGASDALLNTGSLARNLLPVHRGSRRLAPARRERLERLVERLNQLSEEIEALPDVVYLHPDDLPLDLPAGAGSPVAEPLDAAVGYFDGLAATVTDSFRSLHAARLEVTDAYEPARHDEQLARMDWQSLSAEELQVVPPVIVVETAERLLDHSLARFSSLLRSGRPLHVLVQEGPGGETTAGGGAGFHPGLGYLAVAHRETFVLQADLAHPAHLFDGLVRFAAALRPSVALVSAPSWTAPLSPWVQLAAAHEGRVHPRFTYDPEAGSTWADRLLLEPNTQPDKPWPLLEVKVRDAAGQETSRQEAFTFAHTAALDTAYRRHFRVIPGIAWGDEQREISRYLETEPAGEHPRALPFIWVVEEDGALARAVMTRALAFACRDRQQAWRILQELAGTDNEYARRAAAKAREAALTEARERQEQMEIDHREELESARGEAARETMENLARALMELHDLPEGVAADLPALAVSGGVGDAAVASPAAGEAAQEGVAVAAAPEATATDTVDETEEEEAFTDEPYIEAALCTTCHDCVNMNPRMFQYNDDKQAYIADPGEGTFAELVKAASVCPARCIHPGVPRRDDDTATTELVAQAAEFH